MAGAGGADGRGGGGSEAGGGCEAFKGTSGGTSSPAGGGAGAGAGAAAELALPPVGGSFVAAGWPCCGDSECPPPPAEASARSVWTVISWSRPRVRRSWRAAARRRRHRASFLLLQAGHQPAAVPLHTARTPLCRTCTAASRSSTRSPTSSKKLPSGSMFQLWRRRDARRRGVQRRHCTGQTDVWPTFSSASWHRELWRSNAVNQSEKAFSDSAANICDEFPVTTWKANARRSGTCTEAR